MNETIFAPATPLGGAIAILRVSGPKSLPALEALTGRSGFTPRVLYHARVRSAGGIIDDAMAVYFASPNSYTGEDMGEVHLHGSEAVMRSVMQSCAGLGLRMAAPGEFTQRAFIAGKMDLSQAEAVMLAIQAQSEAAAMAAQKQMRGAISFEIKAIQSGILEMLAHIEAAIDYPEEMEDDPLSLQPALDGMIERLSSLKKSQKQGCLLHQGLAVAIVGQPNVGKSSLLNALVNDERAIVTAHAGTTRDVLEARLLIKGIPVRLYDTAGIRETEHEIERIGVRKARQTVEQADLLLLVLDGSRELSAEDEALLRDMAGYARKIVLSKKDLPSETDINKLERLLGERVFTVSSVTGEGLDALIASIAEELPQAAALEAVLSNERQAGAVERAIVSLRSAADAEEQPHDLIAIDLRDAWTALGELTGETASEKVIEQIFSAFCVGK